MFSFLLSLFITPPANNKTSSKHLQPFGGKPFSSKPIENVFIQTFGKLLSHARSFYLTPSRECTMTQLQVCYRLSSTILRHMGYPVLSCNRLNLFRCFAFPLESNLPYTEKKMWICLTFETPPKRHTF